MANQAERYRRLAQECSEMAHTFPAGERRTSLLEMAQVWQRLADEQDHLAEMPTPPPPAEPTRPIVQQQQQSQPKDDDNKD
jgi:hypothetical protein